MEKETNNPINPAWVKTEPFCRGDLMQMLPGEMNFWDQFVDKYLYPLEKNKDKEKEDLQKLIELRNNVCGGMALINILWVAINFMFQYKKPTEISIPLSNGKGLELDQQAAENILKVDVVGLMFIIFFLSILLLQFLGMIVHRWGTFMHLIAITELRNPFQPKTSEENVSNNKTTQGKHLVEFCEKLMTEPMPDYPSDDEDGAKSLKEHEREFFRQQIKNNAETGTKDRAGQDQCNIGASLRNSTMGKSIVLSDSQSPSKRNSLANPDFLKKSLKYVKNEGNTEENTNGLRCRKNRIRGVSSTKNDKSLHRDEFHGVRRMGFTAPIQGDTDFMERVQKLKTSQRNWEAADLSRSFNRDTSVIMEEDEEAVETEEEDETIYVESPGTMSRMFGIRLQEFNRSNKIPKTSRSSDLM